MKTPLQFPLAIAAIFLPTAILLTGCSVFQSSRKIDMTPFSDNTVTMFIEAAKISRPFHWDNLKPYIGVPEFTELRPKSVRIYSGFQSIVMYSNQVVALNNAKMKEKEKNVQLVKYLKEATRNIFDRGIIGIDSTGLSDVFAEITSAETFIEGIAAASPLTDAVVTAMGDDLKAIESAIPAVVAAIDGKIEVESSSRRANYKNLISLQIGTIRGMGQLYNARRGDQASLDTLLREDPSVREFIPSPEKATGKGMSAAETLLTERLMRLDTFIRQMDLDVAVYRAKLRELEDWRLNVDERIKIARQALSVWAQSHRNLGAGIPVPPLIDVTGFATGLLRKASPIP